MNEISLDEFRRDIKKQKERLREKRIERKTAKEPKKETWKTHPEALSEDEYKIKTRYGRHPLRRPRPIWLPVKKWTVGAPVDPIEWQILIRSEPTSSKDVTRKDVESTIFKICDYFRINDFTFSECISRLQDKHLLEVKGGFRHSRTVNKWLHPVLSGQRAGGRWHRNAIHDFIDVVNYEFGCFSYPDRGFYVGAEMPDVIITRPKLVEHTINYHTYREPLKWNLENPIYAEFKSAQDMRRHPSRLEEQLDQYEGVPLYLEVEAKVGEARDMLEERGRRDVNLLDLLRKAKGDMVCLSGSERPGDERSFESLLKRIREALRETYDRKARLKKTGTDPQGREYHELVLYDKLGTAKNCGQVIPDYAVDIREFAEFYFDKKHLGRITTPNYIYTPERKPTYENKTWRWKKKKTRGLRFRSFSILH